MSEKMLVRRAAVLGAGVMGAQIAAQLANAGVDTVLLDLAAKDGLVRFRRGGRTLAVASLFRDLESLKAEVAMEGAASA